MKLENKNLPQLLELLCNKSERKKQTASVYTLADRFSEKLSAQKGRQQKSRQQKQQE